MTTLPNSEIDEKGEDLPTSPDNLLNILKKLNISYDLHHHEAVYTVAESQKVDAHIAGTHCRNLFLRDRKKKNFLVVLPIDVDVDIKKLPDILESHRLSFGSNDRLWQYLGVRSGSVCPFCIINDTDQQVKIFFMTQQIDPKLLEILVCPMTKVPLRYDADKQELLSDQAGLAYPVRDGIPVMLPDEARTMDANEIKK